MLDDLLQGHGVLRRAAVHSNETNIKTKQQQLRQDQTRQPLKTNGRVVLRDRATRLFKLLVRVQVHRVPHDAGVVGQDDKGPHVARGASSLHTPTALQLQVVRGQLFNQEVRGTCRRRIVPGDSLLSESGGSESDASHKPIPAPLKPAGSTSMMWLGQYFLYTAISYSLTTRMWRCDAPSMAWYRLKRPCSWRPVVMVKIGLLMQSGLWRRKLKRT